MPNPLEAARDAIEQFQKIQRHNGRISGCKSIIWLTP